MKIGALLDDAEGLLILGGVVIAGMIVFKAWKTGGTIIEGAKSVAHLASQAYTTVATGAGNAVAKTETAVKELISPDSIAMHPKENNNLADALTTRRDAVNLLDGLRTAKVVRDTLPFNAPFSLWRDFTDWYAADTTGAAVRDNFFKRNPEGVFYD